MGVSVDRKALANAMACINSLKASRDIEEYASLLIENDRVRVRGSNSLVDVLFDIPCSPTSNEAANIVVSKGVLHQIISGSTCEKINIGLKGKQAIVEMDCGQTKLRTRDPEDFPSPPDEAPTIATCEGNTLSRAIWGAELAADTSITYDLEGLYFACRGDSLFVVGTDGRRLAISNVPIKEDSREYTALVPRGGAKIVQSVFAKYKEEDISIGISKQSMRFSAGSASVYCRLSSGRFPKYESVVQPRDDDQEISINRKQFMEIIRGAMATTPETMAIKISIADGEIAAESSCEMGMANMRMADNGISGNMIFEINGKFLLDGLTRCPEDTITIIFAGPKSRIILKCRGYQHAIMPLSGVST